MGPTLVKSSVGILRQNLFIHSNQSKDFKRKNSTLILQREQKEPNLAAAKITSTPWTSKWKAGAPQGEITRQISPILALFKDIRLFDPPRRRRSRAEALRTRFLARARDLVNPNSSSMSGSPCVHGRSRDASLDRMELEMENIWRKDMRCSRELSGRVSCLHWRADESRIRVFLYRGLRKRL